VVQSISFLGVHGPFAGRIIELFQGGHEKGLLEVARGSARQLKEGRQEAIDVLRTEIAESIVLEIDVKNFLPGGCSRAGEASDQLLGRKGFPGTAGADDREDRARR